MHFWSYLKCSFTNTINIYKMFFSLSSCFPKIYVVGYCTTWNMCMYVCLLMYFQNWKLKSCICEHQQNNIILNFRNNNVTDLVKLNDKYESDLFYLKILKCCVKVKIRCATRIDNYFGISIQRRIFKKHLIQMLARMDKSKP